MTSEDDTMNTKALASAALAGVALSELGYTLYVLTQIRPFHPWFYSTLAIPPFAIAVAYVFSRRRPSSGMIGLYVFALCLVALSWYYVDWYNAMWPGFCCGD